jgi:hypothetical protein
VIAEYVGQAFVLDADDHEIDLLVAIHACAAASAIRRR